MKGIKEAGDLKGKRVLVRIDIDDGDINPFPVTVLKPTLSYLKDAGARVILLGHVGRDKNASSKKLFNILKKEIILRFIPSITGEIAQKAVDEMQDGEVILLENVRRDEREMANDDSFAQELACLADVYVNDAFAVSHRKHASLVGITKHLPSFAGFGLQAEIKSLSQALSPESPSMFILSGAKLETKLPLIEKFIEIYDYMFIGGVLANTFFKEKGFEIGTSVISHEVINISSILNNEKILIPSDVVVEKSGISAIRQAQEVLPGEKIVDAGPETIRALKEKIKETRCILWNGPLGEYERGFSTGTIDLGYIIAESSAYTIVGGGDTLAAIVGLGLEEKYSFISTGGGAMLEFLLLGTLPGIEALN